MVFEHIEKLKQEFTDKFVIVDEQAAELQRFKGLTGTVRTVNMNGRALVEFAGHSNIGWYDIDVDFLSVVDKPLVQEEAKPAKKPAAAKAKKEPSKLEKAREKADASVADVLAAARTNAPASGAKKSAGGAQAGKPGAMSVEQMLAAARAEKDPNAPAPVPAASGSDAKATLQQQLETARQPKSGAAAPAKTTAPAKDAKSMSVADMLAAARAERGGGASAPAAAEPTPEPAEEVADSETAEPTPASGSSGSKLNEITDVDAQLAYCRQVDGGSS